MGPTTYLLSYKLSIFVFLLPEVVVIDGSCHQQATRALTYTHFCWLNTAVLPECKVNSGKASAAKWTTTAS